MLHAMKLLSEKLLLFQKKNCFTDVRENSVRDNIYEISHSRSPLLSIYSSSVMSVRASDYMPNYSNLNSEEYIK